MCCKTFSNIINCQVPVESSLKLPEASKTPQTMQEFFSIARYFYRITLKIPEASDLQKPTLTTSTCFDIGIHQSNETSNQFNFHANLLLVF